jgi:hypothetical protein
MSDNPAFPVLTPERTALLRGLVQERLAARRARRAAALPNPAPRHDEVFFKGVAWLDRLSYDDSFEDAETIPPPSQ